MTKQAARQPVVVGVADHGGWAVLVSVSALDGAPAVIDRRRAAIIEPGVPTQPYHHDTLSMTDAESERLVRTVKRSVATCTARAFDHLEGDLGPRYRVTGITIRTPPLEKLPASVKEAHASYFVQCRADGMLYHTALCDGARTRGWTVVQVPRGEEVARAAEVLRTSPKQVERFIAGLGRELGPPWSAEHRNAFAAAVAELCERSALRLPRAERA
jgi:hypothetical protein